MIIQNKPPEFYYNIFPQTVVNIILFAGLDHFFKSLAFLTLVILFFINLFTCTLKRFIIQLKKNHHRRFGPDILHFGLLILIIGSTISLYTKQEGSIFMSPGDSMLLPSGRYLNIEDFSFEHYTDGRPKDWITTANISVSRETQGKSFDLEVNSPLRIDSLVIYQATYKADLAPGEYQTGLLITKDRGKFVIIMSFIFITVGLFITIFQKRKEL